MGYQAIYNIVIHCILFLALQSPLFAHPLPAKKTNTNPTAQLTSWKLSGAIAAKHRKKGWSAEIVWFQEGPDHYQIRLLGPFGGSSAMIEKKNNQITYREGSKYLRSNKAETLLQRQTGIQLPVSSLYYWIRGIAAPGRVNAASYDQQQHLLTLSQMGYQLDFSRYMRVNNLDLPGKIQLHGHGLSIKMLIKKWAT